jgi:hypothetical protein
MGLLRWALIGATVYGTYRYANRKEPPQERRELDGICAIFSTREGADLAIEHLVQEYGIDRAFIYVEPVDDTNSSGTDPSGGDHASGERGHANRADAPLHGSIQLTVPVGKERLRKIESALKEIGASEVEVF